LIATLTRTVHLLEDIPGKKLIKNYAENEEHKRFNSLYSQARLILWKPGVFVNHYFSPYFFAPRDRHARPATPGAHVFPAFVLP